ncbi:MAG: hypothetical protein RLZZ511_2776 [Cyanobacteriota bacterium]|jgi:hypothetical protein
MNAVNTLHQRSMDLAEEATLAQQRGEAVDLLWQEAFELEAQAAALLANEWQAEPTRSVLYRSAATLALRCDQVKAAERLVVTGLMGHPPEEIAAELRDLFVQINLRSFLLRQGIELSELPMNLQVV